MKIQANELEFLSVWAREEKSVDPFALPAHQLQATYQVPSVSLIRAIKAWARSEGRLDEDIFHLGNTATAVWPWSSEEETRRRLEEILAANQEARKTR
jgi:hypothetical protein